MSPTLLPFVLTIAGGVVYHLGQKSAGAANPWSVLTVAYGFAFAASGLLWWLNPGARGQPMRWVDVGLAAAIGLAALAIEAGYFLTYRAGWPVSTTGLLSNLAVAALLTLIAVVAFGEPMTLARAVGAVLAAVGGWLIVRA